MPKRRLEFSEDSVVASFIEEVKKRPCLWNIDDEDYNDRFQMSAAWDEISNILDIRVDTMRMKWKNLRDFFKKIVRKRDIRDVDDYIGRWRYFKSLWFLYKPELARNDDDSCEDATTSNDMKCEPLEFSETEVFVEEQDPIPDKRPRITTAEDYDQMFLKSLTPFMNQLEPFRKLVVRSKIQQILLNEIAAQKTSSNKFY
ncbi:uncharacterized protein [Battus philenor]|uniref:uncharacterized protein n=1 Tax=Battus philenor TaxID=42288 RepID=UPI0035CFA9CA